MNHSRMRMQAGPVPDFAPIAQIHTHESVTPMAPELTGALQHVLGDGHHVARFRWPNLDDSSEDPQAQDDSVIWMRDYQPIFVRRRDGGLKALYYLSQNTNRSLFRQLALPTDTEVKQLPIMHENGNLIATNRHVFFAETLFKKNADHPSMAKHLPDLGYTSRNRHQIMRLLVSALERPARDFVVMPAMPFESTGHIDTYLLPLAADVMLIPSIAHEALRFLGERRISLSMAETVKAFLDTQAQRISELGIQVVRLPMLAPDLRLAPHKDVSEITSEDIELVVYTPANSLLANLEDARHVFVPSFLAGIDEAGQLDLAKRYQQRWADVFRSFGWQPDFVDASDLVDYLGLLRCVSASVPR